MAVAYKCIYCGEKILSDCVFEGCMTEFEAFMINKTKELSDNCKCQNKEVQHFDIKSLECKDFHSTMLGQRAFSTKEIAKFIGVKIYEIRRDIKSKKLKAYKDSTQYYILESDVENYLGERHDINYMNKVLNKYGKNKYGKNK